MLKQKTNILALLKENGYSSYRILTEAFFGGAEMQKIRKGGIPSLGSINKICRVCSCQPGDLIEWVPDEE